MANATILLRTAITLPACAALLLLGALHPLTAAVTVGFIVGVVWMGRAGAAARVVRQELEAERSQVDNAQWHRTLRRAHHLWWQAWLADVSELLLLALLMWGAAHVWHGYLSPVMRALGGLVYGMAAVSLLITAHKLFSCVRLLGWRCLRSASAMRRIALRTRDSARPAVLSRWYCALGVEIAVVLCVLGYGLQLAWSFPWVAWGVYLWTVAVTPPVVLLLSASNEATLALHKSLLQRLFPFRVVALLDVPDEWRQNLSNAAWLRLNCLRTSSDADWVQTVDDVLEIVPLVVLDTRVPSSGVVHEINRVLRTALACKAVLLTGPLGEHPALDAAGLAVHGGLRLVTPEELAETVRSLIHPSGEVPAPPGPDAAP